MIERIAIHRGRHRDSVALMLASREAAAVEGVAEAAAVSATPINLELLARSGFRLDPGADPGSGDMVVAIRARDEAAIDAALTAFEAALETRTADAPRAAAPAPTIFAAGRRHPTANIALISVPGAHASRESAEALALGLHVFCFSSGFDRDAERALKAAAVERGLLMMGPDCGTAIIDGVGFGFSNAVERGPVGIVGASGTGIQQLACLLDAAGVGISQAIGVGGRDLDRAVGGIMALKAIELLGEDEATEAIAVVAKSPDSAVAAAVAERLATTAKPAVLCFPGTEADGLAVPAAATLEDAARVLAGEFGRAIPASPVPSAAPRSGALRGLFCGGTLRDEAAGVLASLDPVLLDADPGPEHSDRHLLVDYGSETFTLGRPHPMIDPSLRDAALEREGRESGVAVLLADVVLGRGSHPDPARSTAAALARVRASTADPPAAVISLCGASGDRQGLEASAAALREAGAVVSRSNAEAARLAAGILAGHVTEGSAR